MLRIWWWWITGAYSSFSPLLGLQFYTLGKLAWYAFETQGIWVLLVCLDGPDHYWMFAHTCKALEFRCAWLWNKNGICKACKGVYGWKLTRRLPETWTTNVIRNWWAMEFDSCELDIESRLKGNTAEAIGALKSALHILQVTHGSGSPLVQSLSSTLNEALAEAAHLHIHVAEWRLVTYNWVSPWGLYLSTAIPTVWSVSKKVLTPYQQTL